MNPRTYYEMGLLSLRKAKKWELAHKDRPATIKLQGQYRVQDPIYHTRGMIRGMIYQIQDTLAYPLDNDAA